MSIDSHLRDMQHPLTTLGELRAFADEAGRPVALHWLGAGQQDLTLCVTKKEDVDTLLAWAYARWPTDRLAYAYATLPGVTPPPK